jgi:hypothetical protein
MMKFACVHAPHNPPLLQMIINDYSSCRANLKEKGKSSGADDDDAGGEAAGSVDVVRRVGWRCRAEQIVSFEN